MSTTSKNQSRRPLKTAYFALMSALLLASAPLVRSQPSLSSEKLSQLERRQFASQVTSANTTAQAIAACDCGFIDLTEGADMTQVWNSLFKADFTTMSSKDLGNGFRFMRNAIKRENSAISRAFNPENAGLCGSGLCLDVRPQEDTRVPSGGVYTKSKEMHFGNYYAEVKIPSTPGTVSAFYIYKTDVNEVDMEYNNPTGAINGSIKDTVKPQVYNGNIADPSTYQKTYAPGGADMSLDFHTWGFHWTTDRVEFGLDGDYAQVISTNVPQLPGTLSFSHWSDGNPNYSGGPPVQDTMLNFRRTWAFWNDTSVTMACKRSTAPCKLDARILSGSSADAISSAHRVHQSIGALPLLSLLVLSVTVLSLA
ncbi:hypothetical protein CF319_g754 [Tilletia indica]|uniref:Uncharacterized protein n=1 Tax=Tilletia indica TaxID=43049 RepID=A0A177TKH4_9BASI|nr:hypothetical protein CF319_g754 [Tilletia indica]KAE8258020.1 hypothetical protein A4X13_0g1957 [Tilletia indica]